MCGHYEWREAPIRPTGKQHRISLLNDAVSSQALVLERETGISLSAVAGTRDPLLGNLRLRDLYLAKPNFRDFAGK